MDKLIKSNGKFMASDDGTIAGLIYTDFNELCKFLRMYNADPELSWYDLSPHKDEASGIIYDSALCYIMPTEYKAVPEGLYTIDGAVIVAFHNKELRKTIYVISDIVLAALSERNVILSIGG